MPRGRKSSSSKWIYFDQKAYVSSFQKSVRPVMYKIRNELIARLKMEVAALPFDARPLAITGQGTFSDRDRKQAVLDSIRIGEGVVSMETGLIRMVVDTMKDNFEQSHIGLYYEYGTGSKEDADSPLPRMGDWNPNRGSVGAGADIYTRTSDWVDAGGNYRKATAKNRVNIDDRYSMEGSHWLSKAFSEITPRYFEEIKQAVFAVNILDYIFVKESFNLGTI
jgi:hypothetical protein